LSIYILFGSEFKLHAFFDNQLSISDEAHHEEEQVFIASAKGRYEPKSPFTQKKQVTCH